MSQAWYRRILERSVTLDKPDVGRVTLHTGRITGRLVGATVEIAGWEGAFLQIGRITRPQKRHLAWMAEADTAVELDRRAHLVYFAEHFIEESERLARETAGYPS